MKKMRLLSLAAVPMFLAQCAPECAARPDRRRAGATEPEPQPSGDCDPNYDRLRPDRLGRRRLRRRQRQRTLVRDHGPSRR